MCRDCCVALPHDAMGFTLEILKLAPALFRLLIINKFICYSNDLKCYSLIMQSHAIEGVVFEYSYIEIIVGLMPNLTNDFNTYPALIPINACFGLSSSTNSYFCNYSLIGLGLLTVESVNSTISLPVSWRYQS